ncbi:hypothetical protein J3R83DRAFT_9151 [Lanmaoa asiatica]|nr:hypothetical protein J3R83DRAFT_9151 [Lanmaoa asiatica]
MVRDSPRRRLERGRRHPSPLPPTETDISPRGHTRVREQSSFVVALTPTNSSYPPRCFDPSDWSRFEKYASRARSFKSGRPSLLDDVARTRTSLDILPNIHTPEWIHGTLQIIHPSSSQTPLSVKAPSQLPPRLDFCTNLCARAPHLRTLSLCVVFPGIPIDSELLFSYKTCQSSTRLCYQNFTTHPQSSRNSFEPRTSFSQDLKLGFGNPSNVASFAPVLKEGAFPCLRELNLSARIDSLDHFFRSSFVPIHIVTWYVNSYTDDTPTEMHTFLTTPSQRCRLLSKLNLRLYYKFFSSNLPADQQLSYDTLKPITFPNLSSFELVHEYSLKITLDELEDLASKLPSLECLVLNVEPLFLDENALTLDLRALLPFARHCPRRL